MSLRSEHEHLVIYIDTQVKQILSHDGEPTDILMALAHKMEDVRKLMDSASEDEKDQYCEGYDGFYLFMTLLEDLASALGFLLKKNKKALFFMFYTCYGHCSCYWI